MLLARRALGAHHLFELLIVACVHGLLTTRRWLLLLLLAHAGEVDATTVREVSLARASRCQGRASKLRSGTARVSCTWLVNNTAGLRAIVVSHRHGRLNLIERDEIRM